MTDKTDIDPAVEAAGNVAEYMFPGCVSASDIDDDDMIELASIIRTAYAPEIVTLINATKVEANKHKRTMAYLEDARAKIQEQAKEIARLHDELTCEFCEKEAGPENPCVCLDCYHESI